MKDFTVGWTKEDALALIKVICRTECECGETVVRIVQHLHRTFGLTTDDFRANEFLRWAAPRNHVALVKYLREVVGLTTDDARAHDLLSSASVDVMKYLKSGFGLTKEDAMVGDNWPIYIAVQGKKLDVVKCLKEDYGITGEDIKNTADNLIERCTKYHPFDLDILKYLKEELGVVSTRPLQLHPECHPEMFKYLKAEFGLTKEKLPKGFCAEVVAIGNMGLLVCLREHFGVTAEDFVYGFDAAVESVARIERADVLRYLHTEFKFGRENMGIYALRTSAIRGCLEVVKCLCEDYGFTAEDIRSNNSEVLVAAIHNRHTAVVYYLWGMLHGESSRPAHTPDLVSLMNLLKTAKDEGTVVDMTRYVSVLDDVTFTMIYAWTLCTINLAGTRFQLERGSTLNIGEERRANPVFDAACRATSPSSEEGIVISRVEWKCTRGAQIELFWQPHRSYYITVGGYAGQTL